MSEPAETELSDREWRQMRRTLSKLEFEPVPETPPLLPRSLYNETPGKSQVQEGSAVNTMDTSSETAASGGESSASVESRVFPKGILKVGAATATAPRDELPSTSSTLSLRVAPFAISAGRSIDGASTRASTGRAQEFGSDYPLQLADLDEHMAVSHEAIRQSVMTAVADLQKRLTKERTMERLQLTASHSTDVTMLQSKIDELKEQIVRESEKHAAQENLLERLLAFTTKYRERERSYWKGDQSIAACFRAWQAAVVRAKSKRRAMQLAARHHTRRLLLMVLRGWKCAAQQDAIATKIEQLQTQHERRVVQVAQEYQLKVEQLQREVEESTREVTALKKCRLQLEEDLCQVFLRGVSTMNVEALQVLNSRRQGQEGDTSEDAAAHNASSSNPGGTDDMRGGASLSLDTFSADTEHVMPEPTSPSVPRSYDTLHNLDSNLQRLLHLSSKISSGSAPTARFEQNDAAVRQQPAPHYVSDSTCPASLTWARPRSSSSSAVAPTSSSLSSAKLRSAEMVQQQQLATFAMQEKPVTPTPSTMLAFPPQMMAMPQPTLSTLRYQSQSTAKLQVEMELLRAEFAAASSKAAAKPRPSMPLSSRWK